MKAAWMIVKHDTNKRLFSSVIYTHNAGNHRELQLMLKVTGSMCFTLNYTGWMLWSGSSTNSEWQSIDEWMDGWFGFNGILSTQVAAILRSRKFEIY